MKSLVAYEKVRDLILSGAKLPGTRLVLSELENELKISKGPLREALMRLDRSGLVHNLPYKGCIVAPPPTLAEMQILSDLRLELECRAAGEALRRVTKEQLIRLEDIVKSSKGITKTGNKFFNSNKMFHIALCECSGMTHVCLILGKFLELIEVFQNLYYHEPLGCEEYNNDHALIIKALREKDGEQLEIVLRRNIQDGMQLVNTVYRVKIHYSPADQPS
jgi:DNA-binding GntR family transcriptional regulator